MLPAMHRGMRLFHFSDDPNIPEFVPQAVRTAVQRPAGSEWLNGALVWAIDEVHAPLYLFPRECPRILAWATGETTAKDRATWLGESPAGMTAWIEQAWRARFEATTIFRYELPRSSFEDVGDVGMWVSRSAVTPIEVREVRDLPVQLAACDVELRVVASPLPLKPIWQSSLHASGIRLRNVENWGHPGWPHSSGDRVAGT